MTLPVKATTLTQGRPKHMENKNSTTNSIVRLSTNDPCCYCYCQKMTSRRKQIICWSRRLPCRRFLFARYASTVVVLSMVLLLASAQDLNNNQPQATTSPSTNSFNTITEVGSHILNTTEQNENITLLEAAVSYANKQTYNVQSNRRSSIKGLNMMSMPTEGYTGDTQSVSMNRNSLISGDSLLQRQLREKAKQDSLESIKLHILMRLNLKKLPNITKPIAVPQNILENFYKTYNASQKTKNSLGYGYGNQFERPSSTIVTTNADEIVKKPDTGNNHNSEFDHLSDDNSSSEMQSDDTNAFKEDNSFVFNEYRKSTSDRTGTGSTLNANNNNDELDDSILSHINSIYVFPEKNKEAHVRHSRKSDVLRFNIDTAAGYSDISYITLHLYLRGLDWINIHQPKLIDEIKSSPNKDITVTLQRAIRRVNSTNYTHRAKVFEFRHKIPSGIGQWVNVDLKPLFNGAGRQAVDMLFTSGKNQTQEIFIKGVETWMRPLIVTTDSAAANNPLTVHIEIGSQKKHRRKRSVFMDCTENDHDMRCCRYPLKVNFTSFGWHFVVAPTSFDAYFCSGDCRVGYLEQYPHTHLAALTTSATPCCSPTKMSSLSLLYFDDNHNLVLSVIPNMSVEGCSCS